MRIGVDLMGSESSPEILFEAVLEASEQSESLVQFVVFLTNETAAHLLPKYPAKSFENKIDFCFVKEFVTMDDDPLSAIRLKRDSSLLVGIKQLGEKSIDAFVSAGNTGALITAATIALNPLGPFDRSALLAVLPTKKKSLVVIDVGGNVSYKSHHLVLYAKIGAAYQRCTQGIEVPKIGLLNIGLESKKGSPELREAYKLLKEQASEPDSRINFVGNVEGREVFLGDIDVLVTDGFTGNVLLKTSEGISSYIFDALHDAMETTPSKDLHQALERIQDRFNYEEHPGALVCGVEGLAIKCHGTATKKAMKNSILGAISLVESNILQKILECQA